jgi:hypothetical protein
VPFDWKEYLEIARHLEREAGRTIPHEEAARRRAISSAYQAAFCHVRNHERATTHFPSRGDPDDHGRLRAHLKKQGKKKGIADRLDQLRQWRNDCDYTDDLGGVDLEAMLATAIAEADWIFRALP